MRKQFMSGICAGLAALSMLPGAASAQEAEAYTNSPVYLYAGPGGDYPVVAQLPDGLPLTVMGCISDYTWCDVAGSDIRGWVYAAYLSYPYQGSEVPIMSYGTVIGLPIVTFAIGSYWDHYYRNRPWYHDRDRWAHRPPGQPRSEGQPPVAYPWHGGGGGRPSDYGHGDGRPGGPPPGQGGGDGRPPAPPQSHGGGAQMGGPPPGQGGWDSRPHGPPQGQGGEGAHPPGPPQGQGGEGAHPPGPPQSHGGGAQMGGPPPGQGQGGGGGGHPGGSPQVHEGGGGNSRGQGDHGGPPLHN